jgi:hypothetical protein
MPENYLSLRNTLLVIVKVSTEGQFQTVKLRHKQRFAKIIVLTREALTLVELMMSIEKTLTTIPEHAILMSQARGDALKKVLRIEEIAKKALLSLRKKPSWRNKTNRWRFGVIQVRAHRAVAELK